MLRLLPFACWFATHILVLLSLLITTSGVNAGNYDKTWVPVEEKFDSTTLEYVGSRFWNGATDFAVSGHYAYIGMRNGLQIVDFTDRTHPRVAKEVYFGKRVECVEISGNFLYLGAGEVSAYDLSIPESPSLVAQMTLTSSAKGLRARDHNLFVATVQSLVVIDITIPSDLRALGEVTFDPVPFTYFRGIACSGNYVFVAAGDLYTFDVSNLTSPTLISWKRTSGRAADVDAFDTVVVVANLSLGDPPSTSSVLLLDAANPVHPVVIASVVYSGAVFSVEIDLPSVYVAGSGGIAVLNIEDVVNPITKFCYHIHGESFRLQVAGDTLFVLNMLDELYFGSQMLEHCVNDTQTIGREVSITSSRAFPGFLLFSTAQQDSAPRLVSGLSYSGLTKLVRSRGDIALVADHLGSVRIIDPRITERPLAEIEVEGSVTDILYSTHLAIICASLGGGYLIDLADANNPKILARLSQDDGVYGAAFNGSDLYVAGGQGGLKIYDILNPRSPQLKSVVPVRDFALAVEIVGRTAFVADRYAGVDIFDVADPNQVRYLSQYAPPNETPWAIYLRSWGRFLIVANGVAMDLVNIDNPEFPILRDRVVTSDIRDLTVCDGKIFSANARRGLDIVTIDSSYSLRYESSYKTPGVCCAVSSYGSHLLVADYYSLLDFCYTSDTLHGDSTIEGLDSDVLFDRAFPNPFSRSTCLSFNVLKTVNISLTVFNIIGQKVCDLASGQFSPKQYRTMWSGRDSQGHVVADGIYICVLRANGKVQSQKVIQLE